MAISNRLKTIISLVTEGYVTADIGTDHGYVPISLIRENICPKAIAVDVSKGSLEKAVENAARAKVSEQIDFRLSDGLAAIEPGEAECIVISGMGGILMTKILDANKEVMLSAKELILSPHRDIDLVRDYIRENGFEIIYDEELLDKKKRYHIVKGIKKPL